MSSESLPKIPFRFKEPGRAKSLTKLIDMNEVTRVVVEDPKFQSLISFKNFKNVYKSSYIEENVKNIVPLRKSSSPEIKNKVIERLDSENSPQKEPKMNLSLHKVYASPSPDKYQRENRELYEFLKAKKNSMKNEITGERAPFNRDPPDLVMNKLVNTPDLASSRKRGSLSSLYSFHNEMNGSPIEKKRFIHPTVKRIFRKVVESNEHGSKTNFEALKEAFAIHDPRELRAINRIPMQSEALPDYNEIIKKLENKIVTTFMDKMSLYRKTFTDNIVEMEENKKYATKKDLGLKPDEKRSSMSVDRQRTKKIGAILERRKSDIMETNERLYNRSMEKYEESAHLLEVGHQGTYTPEELDFMNAVKKGSANQIATKLAKTEELIKLRDHTGQSCLHWAVKRRNEEVLVEILGKKGLDFEARDVTGRRAIDVARNMKYYDMLAVNFINFTQPKIMEDFLKEQIFIKA